MHILLTERVGAVRVALAPPCATPKRRECVANTAVHQWNAVRVSVTTPPRGALLGMLALLPACTSSPVLAWCPAVRGGGASGVPEPVACNEPRPPQDADEKQIEQQRKSKQSRSFFLQDGVHVPQHHCGGSAHRARHRPNTRPVST
eukprot:m.679150 g.679150  ORF g.679150 m.679150 type:complete len:146 (-) comp22810_c0_seq10:286-723(-)